MMLTVAENLFRDIIVGVVQIKINLIVYVPVNNFSVMLGRVFMDRTKRG